VEACAFAQVDVMSLWLSFSSIMLAFVFVFGNSIRNMYEAVIFLFVMHPFDVGDVLMGLDGSWLQVWPPRAWPTLAAHIERTHLCCHHHACNATVQT
jgi:hypothetical protein